MEKNKFYVIIDTNVFISSYISKNEDSPTKIIISDLFNNKFILFYTKEILEEYINVLNRRKFNFSVHLINNFINDIKTFGVLLNINKSNIKLIDNTDTKFYELFLELQEYKPYLITGNLKHFPNDKNILSPKEFIKLLQ